MEFPLSTSHTGNGQVYSPSPSILNTFTTTEVVQIVLNMAIWQTLSGRRLPKMLDLPKAKLSDASQPYGK